MNVRMGARRALGLAAAATMVAGGLGVIAAPAAHAADPVFPGPASPSWSAVVKTADGATTPMTDAGGDLATAHLDLTQSGGSLAAATAFVFADLQYIYFRFHVAALPGDAAGGYVVQLDSDGNTAGYERALRYDAAADAITIFQAPANTGVKTGGTLLATVPATSANAVSYAGANGGAHVAFAVARTDLTAAGINLASPVPMVFGATTQAGVALDGGGLLSGAKADVLGTGKFSGLSAPAWSTLASDAIDLRAIDGDGDGVVDGTDNCPGVANADQADDDAAIDNTVPVGVQPEDVPDGTEGKGNACDPTPRGYDPDDDNVGILDDQCPEQYGALANGCVAQSTTTAILRYNARRKRFAGSVNADFDQCLPRRSVAVFKVVSGPDKLLGRVKTESDGRYALAKAARKGKYYAKVDAKWTLGARCFAVKSPKMEIR